MIPTFVENVGTIFRIEKSGVEDYNFLLVHVDSRFFGHFCICL